MALANAGRRIFSRVATLLILCTLVVPLFGQNDEEKRLANSAAALQQFVSAVNGLPKMILDKGYCVIIFPDVKKTMLSPGGSYGSGVLVCRKGTQMDETWGAPAMYALDMRSLNFQIGSTETDFVLVITSQKGVDQVLTGKTKLGSNVTVATGPTGAQAASYHVESNTDVLTYARVDGPFSGVSLKGASMDNDNGANKAIYGKDEGAKAIVQGNQSIVQVAKPLVDLLNKTSAMRK
jgi:lipid-binding SYLF domain-containing protein